MLKNMIVVLVILLILVTTVVFLICDVRKKRKSNIAQDIFMLLIWVYNTSCYIYIITR